MGLLSRLTGKSSKNENAKRVTVNASAKAKAKAGANGNPNGAQKGKSLIHKNASTRHDSKHGAVAFPRTYPIPGGYISSVDAVFVELCQPNTGQAQRMIARQTENIGDLRERAYSMYGYDLDGKFTLKEDEWDEEVEDQTHFHEFGVHDVILYHWGRKGPGYKLQKQRLRKLKERTQRARKEREKANNIFVDFLSEKQRMEAENVSSDEEGEKLTAIEVARQVFNTGEENVGNPFLKGFEYQYKTERKEKLGLEFTGSRDQMEEMFKRISEFSDKQIKQMLWYLQQCGELEESTLEALTRCVLQLQELGALGREGSMYDKGKERKMEDLVRKIKMDWNKWAGSQAGKAKRLQANVNANNNA